MPQETPSKPALTPDYSSGQKPTNFRWVICGLLFYATTVNYIDRSTLNTLEPTLRDAIHWHAYQYGLIGAAFSLAYGLGFLVMGSLIDKIGTRLGYAVAMIGWSLSGLATTLTGTPLQFGITRFFLGLFEAGNFPAAIKTTAEWFPQKQRATATGIFNAGSNVGAVLAPVIVALLVTGTFWQPAFFVTPTLVVIWLVLWLRFYRPPAQQPRANDAERALIEADPIAMPKPVKWRYLLPHSQAWAFMVGKFFTDPVWWFYLFWSGAFFNANFGVKLSGVAGPLIYIYILADIGSIAGGWLSSTLIKRGVTPNKARKTAMLVCACFVLPVIFAPLVPKDMPYGLWIAATLIGSAAAAHQGFSANIFTTTSDMFPKRAVSSITGLGGLAGALGSVILQSVAGVTIELTTSAAHPQGNYLPMFIVAACAYPLAILLIHLLAPRLAQVGEARLESTRMPRAVTAFVFAILGFAVAVPVSFMFQNQKDYRPYDMKTMITTTYGDKYDALPADLKSLAKAPAIKETQVPVEPGATKTKAKSLSSAERDALAAAPATSADFKEYLKRSDLSVTDFYVFVELKRNLKPEEQAAMRKALGLTEENATYADQGPNKDNPKKTDPPNLSIPFSTAGDAALGNIPKGLTFSKYMAAALPPGDLYKSIDRKSLIPPLIYVPLAGIALFAVLGAVLHGILFGRKS